MEALRRNTVQKKLILDVLRLLYHPTAEEVYSKVVKINPTISLATVYRNLNQMADAKEINRLRIDSNQFIYDINTSNHHHFRCECCNKIIDLPADIIDETSKLLKKNYSLQLRNNNVVFIGRCQDCINN